MEWITLKNIQYEWEYQAKRRNVCYERWHREISFERIKNNTLEMLGWIKIENRLISKVS